MSIVPGKRTGSHASPPTNPHPGIATGVGIAARDGPTVTRSHKDFPPRKVGHTRTGGSTQEESRGLCRENGHPYGAPLLKPARRWGITARMRNRILSTLTGFALFVVIVGIPLGYAARRLEVYRNFRVVDDGVLYRSAQLSPQQLKRTIDEYGIKTVISLRDGGRKKEPLPPDYAEELWVRAQGLNYHRIAPPVWKNADEFVGIMNDPKNHPVLVHCFAGIHRTGTLCAVWRMESHGWSNEDAVREMKLFGYENLDKEEDVQEFLEGYRPRGR